MESFFTYNEFEWLKQAGEHLTIGQVKDLTGVSHYPVFEVMGQVSSPVEYVPSELNTHFAYIKLDESQSKLFSNADIYGRRLLLGQGRTVRELLNDVGITENVVVKKNGQSVNLNDQVNEQDSFEIFVDNAMKVETVDTQPLKQNRGGIDLTPAQMNLKTKNNYGEIKFNLDPAMLRQFQDAPGFVPVITNIQPLSNLKEFLNNTTSNPTLIK